MKLYNFKRKQSNYFFLFVKIRTEIIQVLINFYQETPTAKYYEVAAFNYKHSK